MDAQPAVHEIGVLREIAGYDVPEGARSGHVDTADGLKIRYAVWPRRTRSRKGTVVVFGGRRDFIELYFETVTDLLDRGFDVAAIDWRGQGGSDRLLSNPNKGHVEDFRHYARDLAAFEKAVLLADCPPPYFALAHSMGGAILLHAALKRSCCFDRMVLVGPMVALGSTHNWSIVIPMVHAMTSIGLGGIQLPGKLTMAFPGNPLTSDPMRFDQTLDLREAFPDLSIGMPTASWLSAASRAMADFDDPAFAANVRVPTLLVAGALDTIVDNQAIEKLGINMRVGRHLLLPGARHEILRERDQVRTQFWAAFDAFVHGADEAAA
ncbi:MAG: alpha/beta hydrolase [Pseudomonadota bacterium]